MDSNAFDMLITPICEGLATIFLAVALLRGAGGLATGLVRGAAARTVKSGFEVRAR